MNKPALGTVPINTETTLWGVWGGGTGGPLQPFLSTRKQEIL